MAVLGTGTSNGGCSLLHAAGLGYGATLALDLRVTVRLLDKQSKRVLDDPDDLLGTILQTWGDSNLPLPDGELFWSVKSEIPPRQGLKSSSAVAVAAGLAPAAISTETNGSIICPSQSNGLIGLKPSVGLVPGTGIIPIAHSQDAAGPIDPMRPIGNPRILFP